jgi:hypothetical protein
MTTPPWLLILELLAGIFMILVGTKQMKYWRPLDEKTILGMKKFGITVLTTFLFQIGFILLTSRPPLIIDDRNTKSNHDNTNATYENGDTTPTHDDSANNTIESILKDSLK